MKRIAFKVFLDGRSALDRELIEATRRWLKPWIDAGYPSTRQLCQVIRDATGLDEARARRRIEDLGLNQTS